LVDGDGENNSFDDAGAAYVFVRDGTNWTQQAYLKANNTRAYAYFGWDVSVSADTVVVGAPYESNSATEVNGGQRDSTATYSGAAYVFVRNGTTWTQQAYLKASNADALDLFGSAVTVSDNTVVVGATGEDSAANGVDGYQADNSAENSGAAYVFMRIGTTFVQKAYLKPSNVGVSDRFGGSVSVSGDTVVVSAPLEDRSTTGGNSATDSGAAYVFSGMRLAPAPTVSRSGGDFLLSFPGEPGLRYRVQYTLGSAEPYVWNEFAPPALYIAPANGAVTHRDVTPPDSLRLYRAVVSP
jgi:hypothetical protein